MLNVRRALLLPSLLALLSAPVLAAETVHLTLESDTLGVIPGDSPQTSLGRANTITCVLFRFSMRATPSSVVAGTVTCRKPLDRATPLLLQSLINRHQMTMTARFYRPNPTGDGSTQQHFTVVGTLGSIVGIKQLTPDQYTQPLLPDFEEISFQFNALTFSWFGGGEAAWESAR
ncbi:MAG: type VI secretion system tube protein Hcp [Myxococcota bacterium]|nr:type VI secretion system tube protein Hcp [Myxococcota bacterium]